MTLLRRSSHVLPGLLLGVFLTAAPGCRSPFAERSTSLPSEEITTEDLYPLGSYRAHLQQEYGEPHRSFAVAEIDPEDRYLRYCMRSMRKRKIPEPVLCDVIWVHRPSLGTSLGAPPGIYWDYVFYDEEARVLASFRRFVD